MTIAEYLKNVDILYKSGRATEHSYRGDLTQLIQTLVPEVTVTNEPKRIECGAPDYIITSKEIPIGYIEAKDMGVSLDATEKRIGRVWINDQQYFDKVPETAWNFYIGGYQPAQKWLKDRKGRELSFEVIMYYQKIIVALTETDRLMGEIDEMIEL